MENRPQSNLELQLVEWKAQLLNSGSFTYDNIQELESHLLDEMDTLELLNLSEKERFLVAKSRVGQIENLEQEYEKVSPYSSFLKKMTPYIKGILIYITLLAYIKIFFFAGVYIFQVESHAVLTYLLSGIVFTFALGIILLIFTRHQNILLKKLTSIKTLTVLTIFSFPMQVISQIKILELIPMVFIGSFYEKLHWVKLGVIILILLIGLMVSIIGRKNKKIEVAAV